jgi:hypothetical protein
VQVRVRVRHMMAAELFLSVGASPLPPPSKADLLEFSRHSFK